MLVEEMMRRSRLGVEDKQAIVDVLTENPLASHREVAEATGVAQPSVRQCFTFLGLTGAKKAALRWETEEADMVETIRTGLEAGKTATDVSRESGIPYTTVRRIAKREGIKYNRIPRHGTAVEYGHFGCRCEVCTVANRERCYAVKADMQSPERASDVPHGTMTGYWNWACRCEECCAVGSRVNRERVWTDPSEVTRFMAEWTAEEYQVIAEGGTARSIAVELGRTVSSVNSRRSMIRRGVVSVS